MPLLGTVRAPHRRRLASAITKYALTFVMVFVVALIVDALAPTFGGQKDPLRALKVTAYSFTAGWVAAIVAIIPMLGFLAIIGGLYGLYLLYLGLPVLMRNPPDKSIGYTVVIVICAIVASLITHIVAGALVGAFGLGGGGLMSRAAPTSAGCGQGRRGRDRVEDVRRPDGRRPGAHEGRDRLAREDGRSRPRAPSAPRRPRAPIHRRAPRRRST